MKRAIFSAALLLMISASLGAQTIDNAKGSFPFAFFNNLEEIQETEDNTFVSPLSLWMAMGMVQSGANGNTLTEVLQTLGLDANITSDSLNAYNKQLMAVLRDPHEILGQDFFIEEEKVYAPVLETANGVWSDEGFPFLNSFYGTVTDSYDAHLQTLDLSLPSSMDAIDRWVSDNTHGTIGKLGVQPSDGLRMMLVNTLCFKGNWRCSFIKEFTDRNGRFYNYGTAPVGATMMHGKFNSVEYAHTSGITAVALPYGMFGRYRMNVLMPDDSALRLTPETYQQVKESMQQSDIDLTLPKFSLDCDFNLCDVLPRMGMREAFTPQADFSRMSEEDLLITQARQLSHLEIDEDGTIASAATVFGFDSEGFDEPTFEPVAFNHPFYVTIEDTQTNTILFIGHITNISKAQKHLAPAAIQSVPKATPQPSRLMLTDEGRLLIRKDGRDYTLEGIAVK